MEPAKSGLTQSPLQNCFTDHPLFEDLYIHTCTGMSFPQLAQPAAYPTDVRLIELSRSVDVMFDGKTSPSNWFERPPMTAGGGGDFRHGSLPFADLLPDECLHHVPWNGSWPCLTYICWICCFPSPEGQELSWHALAFSLRIWICSRCMYGYGSPVTAVHAPRIFVDAYYVIRLTCTQPAEKWDGQCLGTTEHR